MVFKIDLENASLKKSQGFAVCQWSRANFALALCFNKIPLMASTTLRKALLSNGVSVRAREHTCSPDYWSVAVRVASSCTGANYLWGLCVCASVRACVCVCQCIGELHSAG